MKLLILAAVVTCAMAAPQRMVMSRLPVSVIMSGRYQLIPSDKIIGGADVEPNSLPFQISLQSLRSSSGFSHSCSGSILDENTILSAAHCVYGLDDLASLRVVAGEHELNVNSGLEQIRNVASISIHPQYNSDTYEHDISLLFLDAPLDLSVPSVLAIKLPPPTSELDPPAGFMVTVSGWGTTNSSDPSMGSQTLKSVDVSIVSDEECNNAYAGDGYVVYPHMLCADAVGVDPCYGDNGGPLFTKEADGSFVQHGILSVFMDCGEADYPEIYTQVSYFLGWIESSKMM